MLRWAGGSPSSVMGPQNDRSVNLDNGKEPGLGDRGSLGQGIWTLSRGPRSTVARLTWGATGADVLLGNRVPAASAEKGDGAGSRHHGGEGPVGG